MTSIETTPARPHAERHSTGLLALVAVVFGLMAVSVGFGEPQNPDRGSRPDQEIWAGNSAHLPELYPQRPR